MQRDTKKGQKEQPARLPRCLGAFRLVDERGSMNVNKTGGRVLAAVLFGVVSLLGVGPCGGAGACFRGLLVGMPREAQIGPEG